MSFGGCGISIKFCTLGNFPLQVTIWNKRYDNCGLLLHVTLLQTQACVPPLYNMTTFDVVVFSQVFSNEAEFTQLIGDHIKRVLMYSQWSFSVSLHSHQHQPTKGHFLHIVTTKKKSQQKHANLYPALTFSQLLMLSMLNI